MSIHTQQSSTLSSQLYACSYELRYLGVDGSPIYAEKFRKLNTEVIQLLNELYPLKANSTHEEASVCLSLLMGFSSTIYSLRGQEAKLQSVLDRSYALLQKLEGSLLKCRLLLYCYAEVKDKALMEEAREIIMSWGGRELTEEEKEMMEMYNGIYVLSNLFLYDNH